MDAALLIARLLLAAVFFVASFSKLADLAGSRQAMAGFGVPDRYAGLVGLALPLAELAIGIFLIPGRTAWWAAVAALALLAAFIAGIGVNLAQGKKPDCHCFGQIYSEPIGPSTLIRNVVLAAIPGFIIVEGRPTAGASALHWLTQISGTEKIGLALALAAFGIIALQTWFLVMLLRQNGRLLVRTEALEQAVTGAGLQLPETPDTPQYGLPAGTPAPAFALSGVHGETLTLDALRAAGKPVVLVFSDPHCGPCTSLMPDLARWQRENQAQLTIAQISRGSVDDNRTKAIEHGVSQVLLQKGDEVATAYQSPGTPSAVLISADGTIARPMAVGADPIRALVMGVLRPGPTIPLLDQAPAPSPNGSGAPATMFERGVVPVGNPAPPIELTDIDGKTVRLSDFKGTDTMLIFWNLGCGFCQQMLPDLKKWEEEAGPGAPALVLISSGDAEENRNMGLRAPVLLDQSFATGNAFGANGTPMAIRIDADGKVASDVAAGAASVFALADEPK